MKLISFCYTVVALRPLLSQERPRAQKPTCISKQCSALFKENWPSINKNLQNWCFMKCQIVHTVQVKMPILYFVHRVARLNRSRRRTKMAWRRSQANPASPCKSFNMSCTRGTNSRLKCLCSRKSWHITKGRFIKGITQTILTGHWGWCPRSLFFSEEARDDVNSHSFCAPSPPACSTSTARPESGIRRLWVMKESASDIFFKWVW